MNSSQRRIQRRTIKRDAEHFRSELEASALRYYHAEGLAPPSQAEQDANRARIATQRGESI